MIGVPGVFLCLCTYQRLSMMVAHAYDDVSRVRPKASDATETAEVHSLPVLVQHPRSLHRDGDVLTTFRALQYSVAEVR